METIGEAGKIDTVNNRDPDNNKNVDTHVTMTQAEYDAITDKSVLEGLQITLTDVNYPDGGLMMVPDYANRETINRTPTAGSSWPVDRTGFVFLQYQRNADVADGATTFFINEQVAGISRLPNEGTISIVPVAKGDVIRAGSTHYTSSYCFFIPPKLVQKLPPIIVEGNGSYSYDEIETNDTWVDGRKIYKKTFSLGAFSFPSTWTDTGIDLPAGSRIINATTNNLSIEYPGQYLSKGDTLYRADASGNVWTWSPSQHNTSAWWPTLFYVKAV
jgi:hypothetical protein